MNCDRFLTEGWDRYLGRQRACFIMEDWGRWRFQKPERL